MAVAAPMPEDAPVTKTFMVQRLRCQKGVLVSQRSHTSGSPDRVRFALVQVLPAHERQEQIDGAAC